MSLRNTPPRRPRRRPVIINAYDVEAETNHSFPFSSFNRASLRAIIAGVLIALVITVAMSFLGLAIGATTLDALIDFEEDPAFDPETAVIVWLAVTSLIALFAGGWVAGRLAGVPDEVDGILHGLVVWGVATLVLLWLFTTSVGRVVNGAADAVGLGLDAIDDGVETVVPEAADAVQRQDITLDEIRDEARSLAEEVAEETDDPALDPDAIESEQDQAEDIIDDAAEDIIQDPSSAGERIETAVDNLLELDAPSAADREDVVNVIVAYTGLSEEEAREAVDEWEARYEDVEIDAEEIIDDVSEDVTEAIALASGVLFMSMVVGALAAGAGGYVGAPTLEELENMYKEEDDAEEADE